MDILKFFCLFTMCYLTSGSEQYKIMANGPVVLGESITLHTEIPNMKRPVTWKCNNNKYECEVTCMNSHDHRVTQNGSISTLWIRKVSWECLSWSFSDANFNTVKIDLKENGLTSGVSSLRTFFILGIGIVFAVIAYTF